MALDHKPTNCLIPNCSGEITYSKELVVASVSNLFHCKKCGFTGYWFDANEKEYKDKFRLSDKEMKRLIEWALVGWNKNPTFSKEDNMLIDKVRGWIK